jgi:transcriptional regulator
MGSKRTDLLQGTLDLLILKILALEPLHGLGISRRLEQITRGTFRVEPGTFFPALYRMEQQGWVEGEWGRSENNRRAKYYRITKLGRKQLAVATRNWNEVSLAIARVLAVTAS